MVKCKVATVTSTIKTFDKHTQIYTNIVFNKDVIKVIESNKSLKKSLKDILHKYERSEIVNCIYCVSSLLYKKNTSLYIFELKGAAILTERVCKDEKEANLVLEDQKEVANSIVKLLKASMSKYKPKRYKTSIFKDNRKFQVHTKFILSLEECNVIRSKGFTIYDFVIELINEYNREESENLVFGKEANFSPPFECEVELISFIENQFYNKRLAIVNKHRKVVKLAEKTLLEWKRS